MNRNLLIPVVLIEALGTALLAFGLGARFAPQELPFRWLAAQGLAIPAITVGAVLVAVSLPVVIKIALDSVKR